jgi:hypothetical protein
MIRSRIIFSWFFAAALSALASISAKADSITTLHMDINSITISAVNSSNVGVPFSSNFTGNLDFSSNGNSTLDTDIDGNPFDGYTGQITGFTGELHLVNGILAPIDPSSDTSLAGSVTVTVQTGTSITGFQTDSYTYDILAYSGAVYRSPFAPVFNALGYNLAGATYNGTFANTDFGGTDVTTWVDDEPLVGDFFQFHYRPNGNGVDMTGDVELYVIAVSPSNSPPVPLPSSLLGGLGGVGMLGVYQWLRARKMNRNS